MMFTKRGFNPDEALQGALDQSQSSDVSVASVTTADATADAADGAEGVDKSADSSQIASEQQNDETTAQSMVVYDKEALEKEKVLRAVKQ